MISAQTGLPPAESDSSLARAAARSALPDDEAARRIMRLPIAMLQNSSLKREWRFAATPRLGSERLDPARVSCPRPSSGRVGIFWIAAEIGAVAGREVRMQIGE